MSEMVRRHEDHIKGRLSGDDKGDVIVCDTICLTTRALLEVGRMYSGGNLLVMVHEWFCVHQLCETGCGLSRN